MNINRYAVFESIFIKLLQFQSLYVKIDIEMGRSYLFDTGQAKISLGPGVLTHRMKMVIYLPSQVAERIKQANDSTYQ